MGCTCMQTIYTGSYNVISSLQFISTASFSANTAR